MQGLKNGGKVETNGNVDKNAAKLNRKLTRVLTLLVHRVYKTLT